MDKLLVAVLGKPNSGKSHTWNLLFGSKVKTGKNMRKLYFNDCEYVEVFLVNGSPEEYNVDIADLIKVDNPKIVLCSAQYTKNVRDTFDYFTDRKYFLFVQWLNPGYKDSDDEYPDNLNIVSYLQSHDSHISTHSGKKDAESRVKEIREYIYKWASDRKLIINKSE